MSRALPPELLRCPAASLARRAVIERWKTERGFLYAAEVVDSDTVKIGYTGNLRRRIDELNLDNYKGHRYRLMASVEGTRREEIELHRAIRHLRSPGYDGNTSEYYPRSILFHPAIPEGLRPDVYGPPPKPRKTRAA